MKIKLNRDELQEQIAQVVKDAGEWGNQGGEIQLYARYDEKTGYVTEFFTQTFAGHNSWIEGDNIVGLYTEKWFKPLDGEDLSEWLESELYENKDLLQSFIEKYKEETGETLQDEKEAALQTYEFEKYFPEKWEEFKEKWAKLSLEHYIAELDLRDLLDLDRLKLEGIEVSNEYPRTEQVQEMSEEEVLELTKAAHHQKTNRRNLNLGERDR
ncbi:hypothetical protein NST12_16515 [Bacillus sp. FSL W8-1127]|uniref:hypothetical protein n=1 Tax=Bacillus sp. FSL W8-1127 TaxID=2954710 RepID=UPI0030F6337D